MAGGKSCPVNEGLNFLLISGLEVRVLRGSPLLFNTLASFDFSARKNCADFHCPEKRVYRALEKQHAGVAARHNRSRAWHSTVVASSATSAESYLP